ncbi:hypothetical protein CP532_3813 [Ophiocordyceps camponoti-leonardi (nom. inval.)]|nr:hypothetical protein CP532_3813 [Ophiocordyceps camponoti-leonardi (nom. inval.)]
MTVDASSKEKIASKTNGTMGGRELALATAQVEEREVVEGSCGSDYLGASARKGKAPPGAPGVLPQAAACLPAF